MAAASREQLEFALAKAGWLGGEYHHIRGEDGHDRFFWGDADAAPRAIVAVLKDARYVALFLEADNAEWVKEEFPLASQVVTQLDQWHAALPSDQQSVLHP